MTTLITLRPNYGRQVARAPSPVRVDPVARAQVPPPARGRDLEK